MIHRLILSTLDSVHPYLLNEATLLSHVNCALPRPTTITQLRAALQSMEMARRVVSVADDLDPSVTKWRITDNGRAAIAATL